MFKIPSIDQVMNMKNKKEKNSVGGAAAGRVRETEQRDGVWRETETRPGEDQGEKNKGNIGKRRSMKKRNKQEQQQQ